MTSFAWKRRAGDNIVKETAKKFEESSKDEEDDQVASGEVDWMTLAPKRKIVCLEDAIGKSERLRREGCTLAEMERYWEAIHKWDEALLLTPTDERLFEMKAQVLMSLCEVFPAIKSARQAVELNSLWWIGHQTLGRAHLSLGEVKLAVKCFSRGLHLNPADEELRNDDLYWAVDLLRKKEMAEQRLQEAEENDKLKITELGANEINESQDLRDRLPTSNNKNISDSDTSVMDSSDAVSVRKPPSHYVCMRN